MTGDVEQVRPFELLNRAATMLGAVICLTSTADRRHSGRRVFTRRVNQQLSRLVVVIPARPAEGVELPRWTQLSRGTVIAQADLADLHVGLDEAAQQLAEELTDRIRRLRQGAA